MACLCSESILPELLRCSVLGSQGWLKTSRAVQSRSCHSIRSCCYAAIGARDASFLLSLPCKFRTFYHIRSVILDSEHERAAWLSNVLEFI